MGDETANSMNLDLNLRPISGPEEALSDGSVSLEEFIGGVNGLRGSLRQRENHPLRRSNGVDPLTEHHLPTWEMHRIEQLAERSRHHREMSRGQSDGLNRFRDVLTVRERRRSIWRGATFHSEISGNDPVIDPSSSVTPAEIDTELLKVAENDNDVKVEDEKIGLRENQEKGKDDDTGSFFDCNICLDLAKDPVVTCCGHLFCWPCVYQWLNIHSVAHECPVCKGEVCLKNLIPIYGRGNNSCGPEHDPTGPKIPLRPHARRVESLRQSITRSSISISMDELVRRLSERTEPRNSSSERLVSYFLGREREELPPPLDDRDSVSSIAAVIQTESQTIDTVLEIDSNVSLSTSTSRRRNGGNDGARASDMDSGDSRAHRRRRLN